MHNTLRGLVKCRGCVNRIPPVEFRSREEILLEIEATMNKIKSDLSREMVLDDRADKRPTK